MTGLQKVKVYLNGWKSALENEGAQGVEEFYAS